MRTFFLLLIALSLLQCKNSQNTELACEDSFKVKSTEICILEIKGLKEVSKISEYNSFISKLTAANSNVIAFYVDENATSNTIMTHTEYASIYSNSSMEQDITKSQFKNISKTMGSYLKKPSNIDRLLEEVNNNYFDEISIDAPVIIEEYSLNENIQTYLLLGRTFQDNNEIVTLTTLNLIHLRKKMILSNYVVKYKNSNSIDIIKQKNDYFINRYLDLNK